MKLLLFVGLPLFAVATPRALTLEQATVRSEQSHPAFAILQAEIAVAQGARTGAESRIDPELTLGPGLVRSSGEGRARYGLRGEVGISQTWEFPGKRSQRMLLADGEIKLRQLAVEGFRQQLAIQVRQAFVQALVVQEVAALRAEQLAAAETFWKSAQNRVVGGYASAFEVVQAQADRIMAAKALLQVQAQRRTARTKLAALMGTPTDTLFELEGSLDSALAKGEAGNPLDLARIKNPSLQAIELRIKLAEQGVQAAHLASKPDLTVNPAIEVGRDDQVLSVGFSLPLLLGNRGRAEVAMAAAERRRAGAEHRKLLQEVESAVRLAQDQVAAAREQLALYTPEFLGALKDLMVRSQKVYDQSATSLLMVLEARRSYYSSLSDHYEAIAQLADAQAELAIAIGISPTTIPSVETP